MQPIIKAELDFLVFRVITVREGGHSKRAIVICEIIHPAEEWAMILPAMDVVSKGTFGRFALINLETGGIPFRVIRKIMAISG